MKIILPFAALSAAIAHASTVSDKRENPFILVALRKGQLCFYGISPSKQIEACYRIPETMEGVFIEGTPNFSVNADRFKRMLETAPNKEPVTIEECDDNPYLVTLRFSEHKARYNFASPKRLIDFHLLSSQSPKFTTEIDSPSLIRALDRVFPSAGRSDVRVELNAVLFKLNDQKLTMMSTDGHRMAVTSIPLAEEVVAREHSIPISLIDLLPKFLKGSSEVTFAYFGDESAGTHVEFNVFFKVKDGECSKVFFGNGLGKAAPRWEVVVDNNTACDDTIFEISSDEMLRALNAFKSMSDETSPTVFAESTDGRLKLTIYDDAKIERREELSTVSFDSGPVANFRRAMLLNYLIGAVKSFTGESKLYIAFPLNDTPAAKASILLREKGGASSHYLMPTSAK